MADLYFPPAPTIPSDDRKQSRLGIASFVVGIASMLIFCIAIVLAIGYGISIAASNPSIQSLQSSPTILALGLLLFVSPVLSLVGTVLGFVAVFQNNTKKHFSILGLVLNILVILAFCVMFIFGLVGQSGALGL